MQWTDIKEFPKGLEKDCFILVKHNSYMSDSMFEFHILKYIKKENKVYKEWYHEYKDINIDYTENFRHPYYDAYIEITGINYLIFEPHNIEKGP
jgi:hypothetical protein